MHIQFSKITFQTILGCVFGATLTMAAMKFEIPKELQEEHAAMKAEESDEAESNGPMQFGAEGARTSGEQASEGDESVSSEQPAVADTTTENEAVPVFAATASDTAASEVEFEDGSGRLSGSVFDKETGEPVRGVAILLENTDYGTITDTQGRYRIPDVPAGEYTVSYIKTGYIEASVTGTVVEDGKTKKLDFALPPRPVEMSDEVYELQDFTVSAEEVTSQNVALLALRQQSIASIDALSSEDFSKFAASDAAEAVSKMSGASLSDGKYVVMRGLNDRYNTTLINGVRLPSPDPDRKAVAMDIFPTSLFERIVARKTFTSDMPGESSGGSIDLTTKSIPDESFFNISFSVGMQEQTTGESVLSDPERARFEDWFLGDDLRGFSNQKGSGILESNYKNKLGDIDFPLMAPVSRKASSDRNLSFSLGGSTELNDYITLGAIFGTKAGWKTRSKVVDVDETIIEDGRLIQKERGQIRSGSEEYDAAFLFGLGLTLGDSNQVNYTYLRSETLSTTAAEKSFKALDEQVDPLNQLDWLDTEISTEDRLLEAHQLSAEHRLDMDRMGEWTFSWYYTAAEMAQNEPDQRLIDNLRVNADGSLYLPGSNNLERVRVLRFNRETEQDSSMKGFELESPQFELSENVVLGFSFGGDSENSERVFEQLETEIRSEAFVSGNINNDPNSLIDIATPVPDAGGLSSILLEQDYLNDAFFDAFAEADGSGGINQLIQQIYDRQIGTVLPNQLASQQTTLNSRLVDYNDQLTVVNNRQNTLQTEITNFETVTGVDYETQFDPNIFLHQLLYDLSIGPAEDALTQAQTALVPIQNRLNTAQGQVDQTQDLLNTITQERADYIAQANALIAQISTMPSAATDSTNFPTYSYFGDENYILTTPAGISIYAEQNPASNSNQFPIVTNKYRAIGVSEENSIFLSADLKLFDRIRLAGGARRESTKLSYDLIENEVGEPPASTGALGSQFSPFVVESSQIDQSDVLPFASLIIDLTKSLKLQLAWSKTIAKPTFREIAPFPIFNMTDGSIEYGNPGVTVVNEGIIELRRNNGEQLIDEDYVVTPDFAGLDIANVESRDIRLEWFTPLDGLIAIGYFEKDIGAPIERVQALQINGIDINTFINNDNDAELSGYEFEIQQNLGVLDFGPFEFLPLDWFTIGGNYTILNAEVERSSFEKNNLTNQRFAGRLNDPDAFQSGEFSTRPLYNQPEYVANAFVSLNIEKTGTRITLSQNWLGKQLDRAGGLSSDFVGSADLFWQSFTSMSLVIEQRLNDYFKLRFTAKNIDSPVRELSEDDSWNKLLNDDTRFIGQPGTDDPLSQAYQDFSTSSSSFRTRQTIEPSYSISISGSF